MDPQEDTEASTQTVPLKGAIAGSGSSTKEALFGLFGGALFGLVSPAVGHPFDCIKTRMQVEPGYKDMGFTAVVRKIYVTEGLRGFYRGFLPPLAGSVFYRSILFSAYSGTYAACSHVPWLHQEIPMTGGLRSSVLVGATAAAIARATIESPLDFIKVRMQIGMPIGDGHHSKQATSMELMRSFASAPMSSIQHLYHGYLPTLFRTMGLLGSFFVMVDYSVRYIPEVVTAPLIGPFFKGGVCATTAWVFAFPMETAKSVIQADSTGKYKKMSGATWKVMAEIAREKGIRGLYRGFGPGAGRSFIANGISMLVYSWFQDTIRTMDASSYGEDRGR